MKSDKQHKIGKTSLIPFSGIAKRIRTIASFIEVLKNTDKEAEIIWFRTDNFDCSYSRLFTLSPKHVPSSITIREATWRDWLFNDTPRKANLFLPAPFILLRYDRFISPKKVRTLLTENRRELIQHLQAPRELSLVATNQPFIKERGMYKTIEPTVEVTNIRNSRMSGWSENVVGVHINRTPSEASQQESPTDLFIKKMQTMLEVDPTTRFFVATASMDERERLQTLFGDNVFAPFSISSQESEEGVIESFGELLALANTRKILTTPGSPFSEVAAEIGHIPLEQLSIYNLTNA